MVQVKSLDPAFSFEQQLSEEAKAVVIVNLFTLDPADEAAFLDTWTKDATYMKARSGFISTQLHRAVGNNPTYLNYAVWESVEAMRAAVSDPGFRASLEDYPPSVVVSPHLFQRVAVPGICIA